MGDSVAVAPAAPAGSFMARCWGVSAAAVEVHRDRPLPSASHSNIIPKSAASMGWGETINIPAEAVAIPPDVVYRLPDSARMVLDFVVHNHPMTPQAIQEQMDLPPRTVRWALRRLREVELVQARLDLDDLRYVQYTMHPSVVDRHALARLVPDHPLAASDAPDDTASS